MAQRTESGPYWAAKASLSTPASVGPTPTPMRLRSTISVDMDTPRMRTCTRLWLKAYVGPFRPATQAANRPSATATPATEGSRHTLAPKRAISAAASAIRRGCQRMSWAPRRSASDPASSVPMAPTPPMHSAVITPTAGSESWCVRMSSEPIQLIMAEDVAVTRTLAAMISTSDRWPAMNDSDCINGGAFSGASPAGSMAPRCGSFTVNHSSTASKTPGTAAA